MHSKKASMSMRLYYNEHLKSRRGFIVNGQLRKHFSHHSLPPPPSVAQVVFSAF
jgi:hypothetical protein